MRFLHVPDLNEIRLEVGKKVAPALQRLKSLDLVCRPPTQQFVCTTQSDALRREMVGALEPHTWMS
jgi:hypothetical protein